MLTTRNILIGLIIILAVPLIFPRVIGSIAGEMHSAYNETMRERGAESYRRRNP